MAWFNRRRSVDELLDAALGRVLDSQNKQIEALSGLLEKMSELSMKRAAQALGSRGGRSRARKVAMAQARTEALNCRLCQNPGITNPTVAEILAHNAHENNLPVNTTAIALPAPKANADSE